VRHTNDVTPPTKLRQGYNADSAPHYIRDGGHLGSRFLKYVRFMLLRRRLRYFSHVMRAKGSLERGTMLGQVAEYRRQEKPQMRWLDSTWKKNATMSQSAECGATVVPEWYASREDCP